MLHNHEPHNLYTYDSKILVRKMEGRRFRETCTRMGW